MTRAPPSTCSVRASFARVMGSFSTSSSSTTTRTASRTHTSWPMTRKLEPGGRIAVTELAFDGTYAPGGVYTFVGNGSDWTFEEKLPSTGTNEIPLLFVQ